MIKVGFTREHAENSIAIATVEFLRNQGYEPLSHYEKKRDNLLSFGDLVFSVESDTFTWRTVAHLAKQGVKFDRFTHYALVDSAGLLSEIPAGHGSRMIFRDPIQELDPEDFTPAYPEIASFNDKSHISNLAGNRHIVSLSASVPDMLALIGAGIQVIDGFGFRGLKNSPEFTADTGLHPVHEKYLEKAKEKLRYEARKVLAKTDHWGAIDYRKKLSEAEITKLENYRESLRWEKLKTVCPFTCPIPEPPKEFSA
ncbi:hypothetical protein FUAX_09850 [Fulvitalea axinellae]|uniref:Uncharacterized protein n=1 Tax=Fulvitalea axinellae TaxID=1182444 RepID=A0AAU9CKL7_9BACT|nr:hypothetical protein FUAX_09850 [Fulvitalea axinellae]